MTLESNSSKSRTFSDPILCSLTIWTDLTHKAQDLKLPQQAL